MVSIAQVAFFFWYGNTCIYYRKRFFILFFYTNNLSQFIGMGRWRNVIQ